MRFTLPPFTTHHSPLTIFIVIVVAASAGCQAIGWFPISARSEGRSLGLPVARTFPAPFDTVDGAIKHLLDDRDAIRDFADPGHARVEQTSQFSMRWPWERLGRRRVTRELTYGIRTLTIEIEQQEEGCLVTIRVWTGADGDDVRAAELLARIGEMIDPAAKGATRPAP
jgi:hypothetical protein